MRKSAGRAMGRCSTAALARQAQRRVDAAVVRPHPAIGLGDFGLKHASGRRDLVLLFRVVDVLAFVVMDVEVHWRARLEVPADLIVARQLSADLHELARRHLQLFRELPVGVPGERDQLGLDEPTSRKASQCVNRHAAQSLSHGASRIASG